MTKLIRHNILCRYFVNQQYIFYKKKMHYYSYNNYKFNDVLFSIYNALNLKPNFLF